MNSENARIFLIVMVVVSAVADTATFLSGKLYQFEINPIHLMTKSVALVLFVKWVVILYFCYRFYNLKINKNYLYAFMFCFGAVYLIIGQFFGAYSNYSVMTAYQADPVNTIPLTQEQAVQTMTYLSIVFFYFPMIIAFTAFWFFERIFLEKERYKLKKKAALKCLIWGKKRKKN